MVWNMKTITKVVGKLCKGATFIRHTCYKKPFKIIGKTQSFYAHIRFGGHWPFHRALQGHFCNILTPAHLQCFIVSPFIFQTFHISAVPFFPSETSKLQYPFLYKTDVMWANNLFCIWPVYLAGFAKFPWRAISVTHNRSQSTLVILNQLM